VQSSGIASSGLRSAKLSNGDTLHFINGACRLLASVGDSPGGNDPGIVSVNIIKDGSIQSFNGKPYLQKHWDLQPQSNGPGYITLYVNQGDFNAYNNYVTANSLPYPLLPTSGSNTSNIPNIAVTEFLGAPSSATTGPGGQYDNNSKIVVSSGAISAVFTGSYWKLSFFVASMNGGYFIHSGNSALKQESAGVAITGSEASAIRLFPNPASGIVYIETDYVRKGTATLMDLNGKVLAEKEMEGSGSFDISALPPGIYLVKYIDDVMVRSMKFVKQ
jgi:hypothetical protein